MSGLSCVFLTSDIEVHSFFMLFCRKSLQHFCEWTVYPDFIQLCPLCSYSTAVRQLWKAVWLLALMVLNSVWCEGEDAPKAEIRANPQGLKMPWCLHEEIPLCRMSSQQFWTMRLHWPCALQDTISVSPLDSQKWLHFSQAGDMVCSFRLACIQGECLLRSLI